MPKGSPWSPEEDEKLKRAVEKRSCVKCPGFYRPDCEGCRTFARRATWEAIAKEVGNGRTHGGVQGRWNGVLDPRLDASEWTPEMDARLLECFSELPTWQTRARHLSKPGVRRNGGDVASRYFMLKKKKMMKKESSSSSSSSPATTTTNKKRKTSPSTTTTKRPKS